MRNQPKNRIRLLSSEKIVSIDDFINDSLIIERFVGDPHDEIIGTRTTNDIGRILIAYSDKDRRLITFEILNNDHHNKNEVTLWDLLQLFEIKLGHRSCIAAMKQYSQNVIYAIEMQKGFLFYEEDSHEDEGNEIDVDSLDIFESQTEVTKDEKYKKNEDHFTYLEQRNLKQDKKDDKVEDKNTDKFPKIDSVEKISKKSTVDEKSGKKEDGVKYSKHRTLELGKKNKNNEKVEKNDVDELDKTNSSEKIKKKVLDSKNARAGFSPDYSVKIAYYMSSKGIPQFTFYLTDYTSLAEGKWINDLLIDWYFVHLYDKVLSKENREKTIIYSSLFFAILRTDPSTIDSSLQSSDKKYSRVRRFVRDDVNIFQKKFIIIPVNENNLHWYLMIICFPGLVGFDQISNSSQSPDNLEVSNDEHDNHEVERPCILIFDSLKTSQKYVDVNKIRDYLSYEYFMKYGENLSFSENVMKCFYPSIPMQRNTSDCGMFVLQYVENFFKDPIKNYTAPIRSLKNWFTPIKVIKKRAKLAHMLRKMSRETIGKNTPVNLPKLKFPSLWTVDKDRENYFSSEESLFSD